MSVKRSVLHSWQQFKHDYDEEQEYLAAERAGVRVDSRPSTRTLKVEHLEGTDMTPSGKAQIRLKGKWLSAIFQPGTRVAIEIAGSAIVIRRAG